MKRLTLALLCYLISAQASDTAAWVIIFDMPHGGCRLRVNSDGSAALAYGALPAQISVKAGTFQPDLVVKAFTHAVNAQPATGKSQHDGSVSFADVEKRFGFSDKALAQEHFRKALANQQVATINQRSAAELIAHTCHGL